MSNVMFYLFSIILVSSALMVIVSRHAVFSLLFLVLSFISSSFVLFLLECEFLALIFMLIYVGAIAVLFLFAIMMLESKSNNLLKNAIKYIPVAFILSLCLLIPLVLEIANKYDLNFYNQSTFVNMYHNWFDLIDSISDIQVYGQVLYSYCIIQLLVAGLILLVVLMGVVYLTNAVNTNKKNEQVLFKQLARSYKNYY